MEIEVFGWVVDRIIEAGWFIDVRFEEIVVDS